jgi:hypothetical protein
MVKKLFTICLVACYVAIVIGQSVLVPNYGYTASPMSSPPTYRPPRPPRVPPVVFPPATSITPNKNGANTMSVFSIIPMGIISMVMYIFC